MSPLISVLLPFYNPGADFHKTLESVLNQEDVSFELILVNNNSDSQSVAVADSYCSKFPLVKLIHENRQGIAFALNAGLMHCCGEYIARMDADDLCLPGRLKKQAGFLDNHPDAGLVSGLVKLNETSLQNEGMTAYVNLINRLLTPNEIYHYRFVDAPFAHPSVMFRKSLIDAFGPYSTNAVPEDYELWLRWFSNGVLMGKLDTEVIVWNDHEKRLSRIHPNYFKAAFDTVRMKYMIQWIQKNHTSNLPVYVWGGGKLSRKKVKVLEQSGIKIEGFIDVHPDRKVKNYKMIHYSRLPPPGTIFIISMVSNRGKHEEIDYYLKEKGYSPEKNYLISG